MPTWVLYLLCAAGLLAILLILYRPWETPKRAEGKMLVGRWVKLVLNTYQDECRSSNVDPFGHFRRQGSAAGLRSSGGGGGSSGGAAVQPNGCWAGSGPLSDPGSIITPGGSGGPFLNKSNSSSRSLDDELDAKLEASQGHAAQDAGAGRAGVVAVPASLAAAGTPLAWWQRLSVSTPSSRPKPPPARPAPRPKLSRECSITSRVLSEEAGIMRLPSAMQVAAGATPLPAPAAGSGAVTPERRALRRESWLDHSSRSFSEEAGIFRIIPGPAAVGTPDGAHCPPLPPATPGVAPGPVGSQISCGTSPDATTAESGEVNSGVLDMARSDGREAGGSQPGPPGTQQQLLRQDDCDRNKCFLRAVTSVRERIIKETSTLMIVTALLAGLSILLAESGASPDSTLQRSSCNTMLYMQWTAAMLQSRAEADGLPSPPLPPTISTCPKPMDGHEQAIAIFSIISFVTSMCQLLIGALIGVYTIGRGPREFLRFLFFGEHLLKSSITSFALSIVSLAAAAILFFWDLMDELGFGSPASGVAAALGCVCVLCLLICLYLDASQRALERRDSSVAGGLLVYKDQLLALEPFLTWKVRRGEWGPAAAAAGPGPGAGSLGGPGRGCGAPSPPQQQLSFESHPDSQWVPLRAYVSLDYQHSPLLSTLASVCLALGPLGLLSAIYSARAFRLEEDRRRADLLQAHVHASKQFSLGSAGKRCSVR